LTQQGFCAFTFAWLDGYPRLSNRAFIPDDGERYRRGKMIAMALVESAVNQVVSRRFVKKQPMRWPERVAYLLLQVRAQVSNETWRSALAPWYPGMQLTSKPKTA
jgi:hypothetical protein